MHVVEYGNRIEIGSSCANNTEGYTTLLVLKVKVLASFRDKIPTMRYDCVIIWGVDLYGIISPSGVNV